MSLQDDKRELLKLKQGIIEESETIVEEKPHHEELHGFARVSNFIYHNKIYIIIVAFFAIVVTFLVVSTVTQERGDARIIIVGNDSSVIASIYFKLDDYEKALESFTIDYDNNGYVHDDIFYIDMSPTADSQYYMSNQAKLYGELATGKAVMLIGNMAMFEELLAGETPDGMLTNLSDLYPENSAVFDDYYYQVKGSALADAAGYVESCPEDLFIAIRSDFQGLTSNDEELKINRKRALEILDNIINNNVVTVPEVTGE